MDSIHVVQLELGDGVEKMLNASRKVLTYAFEDIPFWMQGDPFIRTAYRGQLESFTECFWSLFYLHNESMNTWSHVLAALYFLAVIIQPRMISAQYDRFSRTDRNVMLLYNLGSVGCSILSVSFLSCAILESLEDPLLTSTIVQAFFHAGNSHSESMASRLLKLDYLGITLTISTTAISATCLGLVGHPKARAGYVFVQLLCASIVSAIMMSPDMDGTRAALFRFGVLSVSSFLSPATAFCLCLLLNYFPGPSIGNKWTEMNHRSVVYTCLAASGIAPIMHMAIEAGRSGIRNFSVFHIATTCLCYAIGMAVYVTRVPEKIYPVKFDIWVRCSFWPAWLSKLIRQPMPLSHIWNIPQN